MQGYGVERSASGSGQLTGCCRCGNEEACYTKLIVSPERLRYMELVKKRNSNIPL
jgi:hypothetical protein